LASSSREASFLGATVANKPGRRGERGVSRKTISQGMSDRLRCPVCSCAFFAQFARETADAARIRHSLRPLLKGRDVHEQTSRENTRRDREIASERNAVYS